MSKNYVGSINHTSLTIEALLNRNILIKGIVFNGVHNKEIEDTILHKYQLKKLLHIHEEKQIDYKFVAKYSKQLSINLNLK